METETEYSIPAGSLDPERSAAANHLPSFGCPNGVVTGAAETGGNFVSILDTQVRCGVVRFTILVLEDCARLLNAALRFLNNLR